MHSCTLAEFYKTYCTACHAADPKAITSGAEAATDLLGALWQVQQDVVSAGVQQVNEVVTGNARRVLRGFEPIPANYPPGKFQHRYNVPNP